MSLGYAMKATIYHRSVDGDTITWTPTTVSGVYAEAARAINAASTSIASAPATLIDFPAAVWAQAGKVDAGDYIVVGGCDIEPFAGSAPTKLLPAGGRKIESVQPYIFGTSLDHVEVIAR